MTEPPSQQPQDANFGSFAPMENPWRIKHPVVTFFHLLFRTLALIGKTRPKVVNRCDKPITVIQFHSLIIMSSHWLSCPLIGHHVLSMVIMSCHWLSCPIISPQVFMSSDLSSCPLIGHCVLSLVITSHFQSFPVQTDDIFRKGYGRTEGHFPVDIRDAIASKKSNIPINA